LNLKYSISAIDTFDRDINWLFNFTQDLNNRKMWDKQTLEIDFIGDIIELKKGTRVYTKSVEGIMMETEYLTFKSPNEISVKMMNEYPIFRNFIGTWKYDSTNNFKTTIKITYSFNLKFPYNLINRKVSQKIRVNMTEKLYLLKMYLTELENENVLQQNVS